ncbi:MAG: polysaccharide biosynthesis protein [Bacteroidetes bacterium]|nr:polysaccharide biosynthesis protein [Bacteroidota bacterium]
MKFSRLGIWLIDTAIVMFGIALAHLLRFNFEPGSIDYYFFPEGALLLLGMRILAFGLFKTYTGIIFYTGFEDAKRIFYALVSVSLLIALVVNPLSYLQSEHYFLPYSILIIEFSLSIFLMTAYRALVKILYLELTSKRKDRKKVIIYGAGAAGVTVKNVLDRDASTNFQINAFIDDNAELQKKRLLGIEIFPAKKLARLFKTVQPDMLVFATLNLPQDRKQEIVELCLQHEVRLLNVPPMDKWINGELSFRQIREIRIEDLLEREVIQLDADHIQEELADKVVLVTGAAGSIGSEIARQCSRFHPRKLILLDQAESPLHDLDLELRSRHQFQNFEVVLADVRNYARMKRVFDAFHPDFVYHAAAYKHVPMMERNPSEGVLTNVKGTQITASLSQEYGVEKFVLVSTDKAVNPTSIMGATKRLAEMYVQSLDRQLRKEGTKNPRFITTRFGNVLGSNGSVIPLFKRQISTGGPVTVTHPEMTRFFMTIPEACQLVLEASAMGKGGEIFVFDMGRSIRILDLAKRMIRLSGLEVGKDIQIAFTGLRPGEKLYEEVLNHEEENLPTHHQKILIAKVREYPFTEVEKSVNSLIKLFGTQDNFRIVRELKHLIPEYKSNNSEFEKLDGEAHSDTVLPEE